MVEVHRLIWDEWNVLHIARHGVTPEEVEATCDAGLVLLKESYKDRLMLLGESPEGRIIAIVVGPVPGADSNTWYPFSARPAHRSERRAYREIIGGEIP
jgi:uncharacterized DUF497 family protein